MKDEINVGFLAHPSFVSPEELTSITGPISIAAAEFDNIFPTEKRHETEELLLGDKVKQPFQINLFSGVHHGFGVRGDLSNKQVKYGKEQAFLQAVSWFDQFLKE
jgi:dienelactone hydrolase